VGPWYRRWVDHRRLDRSSAVKPSRPVGGLRRDLPVLPLVGRHVPALRRRAARTVSVPKRITARKKRRRKR
jgi:hypothetical protein